MIIINNNKTINKKIFPTLLLCFAVAVLFTLSNYYINYFTDQNSHNVVADIATQMANNVNASFEEYQTQLEIIAELLVNQGDLSKESIKNYLSTVHGTGMLSSLAVLYPDNEIVYCQKFVELPQEPIFEIEALKAPYLSGVEMADNGTKFAYYTVPIQKNGHIECVMYGFLDMDCFSEVFNVYEYNEDAMLYVVDAVSGNIIVDASYTVSKRSAGYKRTDNIKEIIEKYSVDLSLSLNEIKYVDYYDNILNQKMYAYFHSMEVNDWVLMVCVPRDVVYAYADKIQLIMYCVAVMLILIFGSYIGWSLRRNFIQSRDREIQLQQSVYMLGVQQTLFDSYKDENQIMSALEKVGVMLTAEKTFLAVTKGTRVEDFYLWNKEGDDSKQIIEAVNMNNLIPDIVSILMRGKKILLNDLSDAEGIGNTDIMYLSKENVKKLMLVPIMGVSNDMIGVIGAVNMRRNWTDTMFLDCVAGSFMMAVKNIESYQIIRQMGTIDELTGLYNRNSYQHFVEELKKQESDSLCCIYIDADGLHEHNNTYGHKAGDEMLQYISKCMVDIFGTSNCYRIGGDEFVVFCSDMLMIDIDKKLAEVYDKVVEKGYHISVGVAWYDNATSIENFVHLAERRMYDAKRNYYKEKGDESLARISKK